jgi:excisionase family DNA binding protein
MEPIEVPADDLALLLRGEVAVWVRGCLVRDSGRELRVNGKVPPAFFQDLMEALSTASGVTVPSPIAASGRALAIVETTKWMSVHEAADRTGRSERRIRQLAATGAIRARKAGRDWQVDIDSLSNVLGRAA